MNPLESRDLDRLREIGVSGEEARRQIELLAHPPAGRDLDRPCTHGDGIETLEPESWPALDAAHARAAREGRCLAFVPASGAATRMFQNLIACRASGEPVTRDRLDAETAEGRPESRAAAEFLHRLEAFAFAEELAEAARRAGHEPEELRSRGAWDALLGALLDREGLGYAERPKGLLAFHREGGQARTAFEEHLVEAAELVRDEAGVCRVHFTVSDSHLPGFEAKLKEARARLEPRFGVRFEVTFSVQNRATDTLAVDLEGKVFRDPEGEVLLRPSGHGALIENLAELEGDIVIIKNIDNVASAPHRAPTIEWMRRLVGLLVETQRETFAHLERLDGASETDAVDAALAFAVETLGTSLPEWAAHAPFEERRALAIATLHRPARVCGMVENTGEPGGGPFWVRGRDGALSRQIVESAEVQANESQRATFARGTHFNPVFMACALRDHHGRPYDLTRFVDPDAVIVARKATAGRELLALERPGLWNGAMAHWATRFVEVPLAVFNPVKTVNDLLRPEHQPE